MVSQPHTRNCQVSSAPRSRTPRQQWRSDAVLRLVWRATSRLRFRLALRLEFLGFLFLLQTVHVGLEQIGVSLQKQHMLQKLPAARKNQQLAFDSCLHCLACAFNKDTGYSNDYKHWEAENCRNHRPLHIKLMNF